MNYWNLICVECFVLTHCIWCFIKLAINDRSVLISITKSRMFVLHFENTMENSIFCVSNDKIECTMIRYERIQTQLRVTENMCDLIAFYFEWLLYTAVDRCLWPCSRCRCDRWNFILSKLTLRNRRKKEIYIYLCATHEIELSIFRAQRVSIIFWTEILRKPICMKIEMLFVRNGKTLVSLLLMLLQFMLLLVFEKKRFCSFSRMTSVQFDSIDLYVNVKYDKRLNIWI